MTPPQRDSRSPDAVLCDVDNVVRFYDLDELHALERESGLPEGTTEDLGYAPQLDLPLLLGRITPDEWAASVAHALAGRVPPSAARALGAALAHAPFHADLEVVAALRGLRSRGVPLVLVSNATLDLEADLAALGLDDLAGHVVNSARVGLVKPDPCVYLLAADLAGAPASRCLFVDDRAENTEAAERLGMTGHLFTGPAGLVRALAPLGSGAPVPLGSGARPVRGG